MLFGGNSGSCGGCGCKSCQQCNRTCTNPHTGTAFETVYTLYSGLVGAEIGNPTDGYLTATGDSDTDDPQDGMDGTGPWYQQIEGTFTLSPTTTRHPCRIDISFWRNTYSLGSLTPGQPAPSETLTMNRVTIENQLNSKPVSLGEEVLEPGQTKTYDNLIPKVAGTEDQSLGDPRSPSGTFSFIAACGNETVTVVVKARLEWNVKQRQHILYGIVRECYETGSPCNGKCTGGTNPPNTIYLKISNYSGPTYDAGTPMDIEGTYVLSRQAGFCQVYATDWTSNLCPAVSNPLGGVLWAPIAVNHFTKDALYGAFMGHYAPIAGVCQSIELYTPQTEFTICGTGVLHSGTNGKVRVGGALGTVYSNAFNWEIST